MPKVFKCPICRKDIEPANDAYVNLSGKDDDYRHAACDTELKKEQDKINREQGPPGSY